MPKTAREYDPAKHGRARVFSGACADARVEGTVDGYHGRPGTRAAKYHGLARQVYIEAYREHARPGQQLALF